MGRNSLAIVIPAFNESTTIGDIIIRAKKYGLVIVVDDCSQDNTKDVAEAAGAVVIRNAINSGYDFTISRGFEEAESRGAVAVVTMDADGEHDPLLLKIFRELLLKENWPIVIGIRLRKQRFSELIMGIYVKVRFGVDDILCGMKGYNIQLWRDNEGFDHQQSIGTELTLNSIRRGANFSQIYVTGVARNDSPRFGNILNSNIKIFIVLIRMIGNDLKSLIYKIIVRLGIE